MPGSVEMGRVMGGEPDPFDRPSFAVGQVLLAQAGKELDDICRGLPVSEIVDLGPIAWGIGRDVILQRNGDVDQFACHMSSPRGSCCRVGELLAVPVTVGSARRDLLTLQEGGQHAGLLGCALEDQ